MTYRNAKKLHNGDEVIVKETQEVVTVITAQVTAKDVTIDAQSRRDGYSEYHHTEIE